jgi:AAA domain
MPTEARFQPGNFIAHLNKCGFRRRRPVVNTDNFEIHTLDLTPLKLNVSQFVPCLIPKKLTSKDWITIDILEPLLPLVEKEAKELKAPRALAAILAVGGKLSSDPRIVELFSQANVAIIDRTTIEAVTASEDLAVKSRLLGVRLSNFIERAALSPYVAGRPAVGPSFFGRSTVIKRILPGNSNWTIIGNRRIGKTSLLKEIKERLELQHENRIRTVEIYGHACKSTWEVAYHILLGLKEHKAANEVKTDPFNALLLPSRVHKIPDSDNQPVAIFIDELDYILDFDAQQDYEVLHLLRDTFEHPDCRIFLAGFRRVMKAKNSQTNPLFNFTNAEELHLLTREECQQMISLPLTNLGIELNNSDLPAMIYRETGGHPELIQVHCATLIRLYDAKGRIPDGAELLKEVFNDADYRRKVQGAFLANTNAVEQLLCYLLIAEADKTEHAADYEFGIQDVDRVLKSVEVNLDLQKLCAMITNLKVSGYIAPLPGRREHYRFSAPQLVGYFLTMDLDFCIAKAQETVQAIGDIDLVLWADPDPDESDTELTWAAN